jgi:hypothetical protein
VVKLTGGSHLSVRGREGKREGGPARSAGPAVEKRTGRGGKKKKEEKVGRGWKRGREEEGLFFSFSFSTLLNKTFKPFTQKKPFQVYKIILKTFKPHNQKQKPMHFNMMHKHLGIF